ncbi:alpha/beta fold hydrolase [Microbulbifer sp. ZKSA006]|uniref:alpha/beta fold hydrolase n=1 Tax=Microbulbifer sp. ZKSA006 TaxID=3243390 RepID=UPI00403A5236
MRFHDRFFHLAKGIVGMMITSIAGYTRFIFPVVLLLSNMTFAESVQDTQYVGSKDASLFVEIAGVDKENPLILFLHGGPGDVELGLVPFQATTGRKLEEKYLVAYLHQRGAGKSPEVKDATLTIDNHLGDVRSIVNFLKNFYKKDKITLIGHSWGGALAALYASKHPEELDNIVFISSFQDAQAQAKTSFDATLQWFKGEGNELAIDELKQYQDNPEDNYFFLSKWASRANGSIANGVDIHRFIVDQNINNEFPGWEERRGVLAGKMEEELQAFSVNGGIDSIQVPALFVVGNKDTITTSSQVKADFERYSGHKCLSILEDSHHLPFLDAEEALSESLLLFLESGHCANFVL